MIYFIFTIDYEIYGNGDGSLRELVYEPTERLARIFRKWDSRFVLFVEVAELEMIAKYLTDEAVDDVRRQVKELYEQGIEIGLHVHPQWYNALYENGRWFLDYSEYNLCNLPRARIQEIIIRSIAYLQDLVGDHGFTPLSFRAGNWLLQPTERIAAVLAEKGIKIDSSVFKGGLQRKHGLDYRRAMKNGYSWRFQKDVNVHDDKGLLVEIPTYTTMVPIWRMVTSKRIALQRKSCTSSMDNRAGIGRYFDYMRLTYPKKCDYCRMTIDEITSMVEKIIEDDRKSPEIQRPIVAIGHTKDLVALNVVDELLSYLNQCNIPVTTFRDIYSNYLVNG